MTIYGSDVSHYDASDTRAMFGQDIVFQTHKAGGDANDAELQGWWAVVKPYRDRVLLGAYWVLYPGQPNTRADAFLSRLDSQCPGWRDGPFILQVDCEKWSGDSGTVPNKLDITTFCDRLVAKCPKLRPIVYAPNWVYGGTLKGLGYPLWASAYVTGAGSHKALYPGDSSSKWAAYSGQTPAILQYTSSATIGGQTTCDANAYRGTLTQLTQLVAPGWTEEIDMALDAADKKFISDLNAGVVAAVKALTTMTPFATGGGQHSPISDAVLNGSFPPAPGKDRDYVWRNLQAILVAASKDDSDEASIITGVLAGLSAEVAAGIPADIAQQTVDILTARLQA